MRGIISVAAAWSILFSAVANADERPVEITGVVNYQTPNGDAVDTLSQMLEANVGKVVRLKLELIPRQDDMPGYSLQQVGKGENEEVVICGNEHRGLVDNYSDDYQIEFGHPENFHLSVTLYSGVRKQFPFNIIACGLEDYTSVDRTHLHVDGDFVVSMGDIPTMNQYILAPYPR